MSSPGYASIVEFHCRQFGFESVSDLLLLHVHRHTLDGFDDIDDILLPLFVKLDDCLITSIQGIV